MKQIHKLFEGTGDAAAVLEAANKTTNEQERRNHLCYAHLYLGLYHEALGNDDKAKAHMLKSAVDHRMDHYMGKVAQVHAQLRGWTQAAATAATETAEKTEDNSEERYTTKTPSRDGTGKIYMGREISQIGTAS